MKKIIALLITTILLMTACQPTPDKEVVIQRDNTEKMVIEAANEENDKAETEVEEPFVFEYETPAHISERFSLAEGVMDIVIEADVTMPELTSVPVAKIKSSSFTQERADELREYFMQEGKLVTEYVATKEDYDARIIEAKRGHEVDGEMVFDESDEQWIAELMKKREKAPDEDVSNLITDYSISGEEGLQGRIVINGEDVGYLGIMEDYFGFNSGAIYRVDECNQYDDRGLLIEYPKIDINITEQEAINIAQSFLSELNIEGMVIKKINEAYYYDEFDLKKTPEKGGYHLVLMRGFGGMLPVYTQGYGIGKEDKYEVSPPMHVEEIRIAIDDTGKIHSFSWKNPIEIIKVLTEHVDILPFEDIMERLRTFSKIQWAYYSNYAGEFMSLIKVTDVELSLMYLPIKNNATEFMYAPCWAFAYKQVYEYSEDDLKRLKDRGITPINEDEIQTEYLIFSAIDGASVSMYTAEEWEEYQQRRAQYEAEHND